MKKINNLFSKNNDMKKLLVLPIILISLFTVVSAETYYKSTQTTFMISLSNYVGQPVEGNCTGYVFYPNMTLYKEMNLTYNNVAGVYYAYFTVPNVTGVYLEVAKCNVTYPYHETIYARKTFRVTDALSEYQTDIHNLVRNSSLNMTVNITGNITQGLSDVPFETWKFFKMMAVSGISLDDPQVCINSTALLSYTTRHICIGQKCFDINSTQVTNCEYGCDNVTNSCNPPPLRRNFYLILSIAGLGILALIIYYIMRR